mgnify:CR=1 FL=1
MNAKETKALSVSQLSDILKACFENPMFSNLRVYGEVYSIRLGKFSYIDLGDQGHKETNSPLLRCAFNCYYGSGYGLESIKPGDVIEITGSLSYYAHGSSVTLWGKQVTILQSQLGKSLLEKKKTLEKLDKLGYLDEKRKRKIPRFVRKVAIVTAQTGAAYQDILKTLHDRFPVDTYLYPTIVQGEGAAKSIVKSIRRASECDYDVVILGRGGGSKTDLSCFDDYEVALAIAECPIPVITCIGHTIDTAIADRVSDYQAITPTEGASLINPSLEEIQGELEEKSRTLLRTYQTILNRAYFLLSEREKRLESLSPENRLKKEKEHLVSLHTSLERLYLHKIRLGELALSSKKEKLRNTFRLLLGKEKNDLLGREKKLSAYDPSLLSKEGYALVFRNGKKVKNATDLKEGEEVTITFVDGRKDAIIKGGK